MGIDPVVTIRFFLTGIALFLALLATIVWRRRKDAPEAATFTLIVVAMAIYTFGYAGELAQTTVPAAQRWLDFEYLALPWFPGLWLLAACRHNGIRVRTPLLFIIPVIVFAGHFTNVGHLFYTAPLTLVPRGPFQVLEMHRGPLSLLDNAYLLEAFLAGGFIYLSGLRHASTLFRRQALVLLVGSQLPLAGYFLYLAGLSPWGLDITPIAISISCAAFYYGIFRGGIFDLAPLARTLIFNSMRDAVLIVDGHERLLDFNPAAQALLPALDAKGIGTGIANILAANVPLVCALVSPEGEAEINLGTEQSPRFFEIRNWPLVTATRQVGRAVIFADVTAQVHLREELRLRAETDPLTLIANRRRFHQVLEAECLRLNRSRAPLSLLMIDLDYFKDVNDRYGHPFGDVILRSVAQRLAASLRKTDLLARFGGEEFSVLLPETPREGARIIAERIRCAVEQAGFEVESISINLTISIGVSSSHVESQEADPEVLLKEADLALYRAKATGRNRVEES